MRIKALKRRRQFAGAVALGFAALALAAPAVAAGPPFASTPTIDGGYGAVGDVDQVAPAITGEKAYGFDAPSVTPVVASASNSSFNWDVVAMALALGAALSMLALLGVVMTRSRSRETVLAQA